MSHTKPFETYRPWKSVNPDFNPHLTQVYPDDDSLLVEDQSYASVSIAETAMLVESVAKLIDTLGNIPGYTRHVRKLADFSLELVLGRDEEHPIPETEKIEVVEASSDAPNPVI
jgi:hypothetical protein